MGIDLEPIGNHNIIFEGKSFYQLGMEIKNILNNITISNLKYFYSYKLDEFIRNKDRIDFNKAIHLIKNTKEWIFRDDEFGIDDFNEFRIFNFYGPSDLSFYFEENYITFFDPTFRFKYWFYWIEKIHRDEWRKYMCQIVKAFGGDKVIYLPDNMADASKYIDRVDILKFEEIKNGLINEYGEVNKKLDQFDEEDNEYIDYYIDNFEDINWSINAPTDEFLTHY